MLRFVDTHFRGNRLAWLRLWMGLAFLVAVTVWLARYSTSQSPPAVSSSHELATPASPALIVLPAHARGDSPARSTSFIHFDDRAVDFDQERPLRLRPPTVPPKVDEPNGPSNWPELSESIIDSQVVPVRYVHVDDANAPSQKLTDGEARAPSVWPNANALLAATDRLANWNAVAAWRYDLAAALTELNRAASIDDQRIPETLGKLRKLANQLDAHIIANSATPVASPDAAQGALSDELRRLQHKVRIRVDLWTAAHEMGACQYETLGDFDQAVYRPPQLGAEPRWLDTLAPAWREHLKIDALQAAFQAEPPVPDQMRAAARQTLARMSSPILNSEQNEYLRHSVPPEVVEWLMHQARGPCDLVELLRQLESFLETQHGYHADAIATEYQNLLWHEHPRYQALAQQIETHLRNANLRVSVSDVFLNLLVPELPDVEEPVREHILGANVHGRSRIANRLQVRLLPDPERINLRLDAFGLVRSSTQASRGGFVVDNLGTTRFQASKPLAIGRHGLAVGPPHASVDSDNQVVGLRSNFDGIPFLAGFARRMAHNQIASQKQAATNQLNRRVEQKVKNRLDSEIEGHLDDMRSFFYDGVIQPLIALDLEPLAMETRTTHDRLIMRYRLAGIDQLAAVTPRPGGVQSSLLAIQIHQSAFNNLLGRIELNGRVFTPEQLTQHLGDTFGVEFQADPRAPEVEARMEFAPYDPIAIGLEDGMIAVKLNVRQLQVGRGRVWKRFSVESRYTPIIHGTQLILQQEANGIRVVGNQLNGRDQVAILGIFNAVFKSQYELRVIPDELLNKLGRPIEFSQFEITDGWLAISLDARQQPPAAPAPRQARVGLLDRH